MIKEALEYILGLNKVEVHDIDGKKYSDKSLYLMPAMREVYKDSYLHLASLDSLVDMLTDDPDGIAYKVIVNVVDHNHVNVVSKLFDELKQRETFALCQREPLHLDFGKFVSTEELIIMLMSKFKRTIARDSLMSQIANIKAENGINQTDDGVAQNVTVRKGISFVERKDFEPIVRLMPFRTFSEIEQPESPFLVRLRMDGEKNISAALFEADGQEWKHKARQSIAKYLRLKIPEAIIVLS